MTITEEQEKNFLPTNDRICFWLTETRSQFDLRWANVFDVSDLARQWDGTTATKAIDSQMPGVFSYVSIDITGKKETAIPGTDERGTRIRLTFDKGTEDELTTSGWIVQEHTKPVDKD